MSLTSMPPEVIELGELHLRRLHLADGERLTAAIAESIEQLRPWMDWAAREPMSSEERAAELETWNDRWVRGIEFHYGLVIGDELVGACGLHTFLRPSLGEHPYLLAIGYWVRSTRTGRGYATRAVTGLTTTAFELREVGAVEIHHDKENLISARIPARLGYTFIREAPHPIDAPGQSGVTCIWRTTREDWMRQQRRV